VDLNRLGAIVLEGDSERDSDHDEQLRVIRLTSTLFLPIDRSSSVRRSEGQHRHIAVSSNRFIRVSPLCLGRK
jgi:hypothetical protein